MDAGWDGWRLRRLGVGHAVTSTTTMSPIPSITLSLRFLAMPAAMPAKTPISPETTTAADIAGVKEVLKRDFHARGIAKMDRQQNVQMAINIGIMKDNCTDRLVRDLQLNGQMAIKNIMNIKYIKNHHTHRFLFFKFKSIKLK